MKHVAVSISSVLGMASFAWAGELADPVPMTAPGGEIDVSIGHAAPYVTDMDGDGVCDLLVGQFGEGRLHLYKNAGTKAAPRLAESVWVKAGGEDARIPSG